MLPIRQIKPKSARTKRILDNKGPQTNENSRTTLFLKYTTTSDILQLCMTDLFALKRPLAQKFNKKNPVRPFEDPASLEFFSDKNDASLMVYGSHSKKRPHALTLARFFGGKVLDMIELMIEPETMRTLAQFKNGKAAVGLKPLLSFSGSAFDDPSNAVYGLAKSILLEMFRGPDVKEVDVEGLQYMICFSVDEAESADAKPMIHLRTYLLRTKKAAGSTLPKVELEEMGPRIDFRVGRHKDADSDMMKEAMRKPKGLPTERPKKNIDTDIIGDKVGRIHLGKQDLGALQTRKMKGLKRSRDVVGAEDVLGGAEEDGGAPLSVGKKTTGLLDLPAEIWTQIGREVVTSEDPIALEPNYTDGHYRMRRNVLQPGITRVCRILREELLPIFYANHSIYKTNYHVNTTLLVRWLRNLPRDYSLNVYVLVRDYWDSGTQQQFGNAGFDIVDRTRVKDTRLFGSRGDKFRVVRRAW
ncbi:rRNA-binding ribosome biosynthesis protein rpf2 [Elasticomyces elasticus]|nr:rRNA-binding ribosome biosynthesis protein rpf2 [Elasticomyces elasticus]KAK4975865.1 rRNA-binding ribosome biosynthesis protein rpf2 [Elasticomyces elasticus]